MNPSAIESNFTDKTGITYLTDDITDRAVEFLNEAKQDKKPFFMFVSYNAPHWPMQAKPEDIALFKNVQNRERRLYCAMVYAMDQGHRAHSGHSEKRRPGRKYHGGFPF